MTQPHLSSNLLGVPPKEHVLMPSRYAIGEYTYLVLGHQKYRAVITAIKFTQSTMMLMLRLHVLSLIA